MTAREGLCPPRVRLFDARSFLLQANHRQIEKCSLLQLLRKADLLCLRVTSGVQAWLIVCLVYLLIHPSTS